MICNFLDKLISSLSGIAALVVIVLFFILGCQQPSPTPAPAPTPPSAPANQDTWTADGIINPGEYSKSKNLGGYELNWHSDGRNIYFGIMAKTTGWISLGIQPGTRMKGADIVLGYVEGGQVYVSDHFSAGDYGPHKVDTEFGGTDDILDYGGREQGEYTTIEFKRALNTGDKYDHQLSPGLNDIIWAFGSDDKPAQKHITRGYGEIDL